IVVGRSGIEMLTNEAGEVTRSLSLYHCTCIVFRRCCSYYCYVFDEQPPELKKQELAKRYSKRVDATKDLKEAVEAGNKDDIEKFSKRTVKAHSEAEAQCAALCKSGKACILLFY
ncbi:Flap endonuclease 1, partial [Linum perenne]